MAEQSIEPHSILFLSCDIVGSTQYKQRNADVWRKTFLSFYREFPQKLATLARAFPGLTTELRLWKAVGDELIFSAVVKSESDVFHAVRCWVAAMDEYERSSLTDENLATKGGAFIATFPAPDSESSIPIYPESEESDADVLALNEAALRARDESRYRFDYFGPSVDTGFRVFSLCSERYFTLSMEVAWAMTAASTAAGVTDTQFALKDLVFRGTHALKGVWNGREYPLFALDRKEYEGVNRALEIVQPQTVTANNALTLCRECCKSPGWPSHLYLPEATHTEFKTVPQDPASSAAITPVDGFETIPKDADDDTKMVETDFDALLNRIRERLKD